MKVLSGMLKKFIKSDEGRKYIDNYLKGKKNNKLVMKHGSITQR